MVSHMTVKLKIRRNEMSFRKENVQNTQGYTQQ